MVGENRAIHEAAIAQVLNGLGKVKGVAFAVTGQHLLTCAHVVNAVIEGRSEKQADRPQETVKLCFPWLGATVEAKVVYWKAPSDDRLAAEEDIAGLELLTAVPGMQAVEFADYRDGDRQYAAMGYPEYRPNNKAVWATNCTISETVSPGWVQIQGTWAEGRRIECGFSGTPVFDSLKTFVFGMVVAEYQDPYEDTPKIAYMLPSRTLQSAIWVLQVLDRLSVIPNVWPISQKVLRACQIPGEFPVFVDLEQLLADLVDRRDRDNSPVWLVKFIARLSWQPELENHRESLHNLGRRIDARFDESLVEIHQAMQQSVSRVAIPYLLLEVSEGETQYNTRALFIADYAAVDWDNYSGYRDLNTDLAVSYGDDAVQPCDRTALPSRLVQAIEVCQESYEVGTNLKIVVAVPPSLIVEPIDQWRAETEYGLMRPGTQFELVVGCQTRRTVKYKRFQTTWRDRWNDLQNVRAAPAINHLSEATSCNQLDELNAKLVPEDMVGFKLVDPCLPIAQSDFLPGLLGTAAPVAIWLRKMPSDGENLGTLETIDGILSCCCGDLVQTVTRLRAEAIAARPNGPEPQQLWHVGHHISLIWEDPNLTPKTYRTQT
jgi:hypothetical protein